MSEFIPNYAMRTARGTLRPIVVTNVEPNGTVHYTGMDGQARRCGVGNLCDLDLYDTQSLQRLTQATQDVIENYSITSITNKPNSTVVQLQHPTDDSRSYVIVLNYWHCTCTCPAYNGDTCKHIEAATERLKEIN